MLYFATTRRVKGDISAILAGKRFESFIHQAAPTASLVEATADEPAYWVASVPSAHGAAVFTGSHRGPYTSQAEAIEDATASMKAAGWRETKEEAEADAAREIEHRTKFRADGKPRKAKA